MKPSISHSPWQATAETPSATPTAIPTVSSALGQDQLLVKLLLGLDHQAPCTESPWAAWAPFLSFPQGCLTLSGTCQAESCCAVTFP